VVEKSRTNTVPNQIVFDAILKSGAVLTYKLHNTATISPGAKPSVDGRRMPALDWRIFGSKGEIRITNYVTWALNAGSEDTKIEIYKADDGVVSEVDLEADEFKDVPLPARNIARVYEAFAAGLDVGGNKKVWYPDFEHALKRHELIEEMYRSNGF
jgi:predicted dehydrogenase